MKSKMDILFIQSPVNPLEMAKDAPQDFGFCDIPEGLLYHTGPIAESAAIGEVAEKMVSFLFVYARDVSVVVLATYLVESHRKHNVVTRIKINGRQVALNKKAIAKRIAEIHKLNRQRKK
jgi:hypothetical protein